MAGLLDALNSDDGMLGMGLLAAAAPSMEPTNTAARLANAMGAFRGMKADQLKQQFGQAQMADMQQQMQMRGLQLQQAQQEWQLQQPLLQSLLGRMSGGAQASPAAGPSQPAIAPSAGGGLGSGTFGMSMGGQAASAPAMPGAPASGGGSILPGVPDDVTRWAVGTQGLKGVPALMTEYNKPTDFQKMLTGAGIDPASALGRQLIQANLAKQNYIAPTSGRPGGYLKYADGSIEQLPTAPEGYQNIKGADGAWHTVPVQGGIEALAGSGTAKALGKLGGTLGQGVDDNNKPTYFLGAPPGTIGAPAAGGAEAKLRAQVAGPMGADPAALDREIRQTQNDMMRVQDAPSRAALKDHLDDLQAMRARISTPMVRPAPPAGFATGQEAAQKELSDKWTKLTAANSEAQNTSSYLDSIVQMASKAATGPFSDKLQFSNALLGLVGNEKAQDATTANNLLDKYSNQIVARLGTGGLGTDAARSILQSAYPNAHMTEDAIREAAGNIKGAQSMLQSKVRLLQQAANTRNPAAYSQAETSFDQAADPRIFQLANMDKASAQAMLSKMPATVQKDLAQRMRVLKQMGAF